MGVRLALGASRGHVVGLVMSEAGRQLVIGIPAGVAASYWAGKTAASLLYGLKADSPMVLGLAAGILICVALLASFLPARRAARLNPVDALRDE